MSGSVSRPPRRALIIGGSLGGLFAGGMLRQAGWDVDVFERSAHDLDSRGGGIALQPVVVEVFKQMGAEIAQDKLGVQSTYRAVYAPDGSIVEKEDAAATLTSWSLVYTTMRDAFGEQHYHKAKTLVDIRQDDADPRITATFDDGSVETADLLVGADGGGSVVRQQLWPAAEPVYAGYVAWRGLVPEDEMPPEDELFGGFCNSNTPGSHILGYLVPGEGNDLREGRRFYNWVWYRVVAPEVLGRAMTDSDGRPRGYSVPEGKLASEWRAQIMKEAEDLPAPFRAVVKSTREPFAQAIRDLAVPSLVKGRVLLLGDAAFIPRPHTFSGASNAAVNALALGEALRGTSDVDAALAPWAASQLEIGQALVDRGRQIGDHLLFRREPAPL